MAFLIAAFAMAVVAALGVQRPAPATAQAAGPCKVFDDPGVHGLVVPAGVTQIEATVFGGQGGDVIPPGAQFGVGGLGGGATGVVIPVTPGETLEVVVGGAGRDSTGPQSPAPPGGSPGGGGAGAVGSAHTSSTGGGASSIRRGAQTLIIVGGGGGGAHGGSGGAGGLTGTDGTKNVGSTAGSTPGLAGGNGGLGGDGGPDGPANHDGQDGSAGQGGAGGGGTPPPTDGGGGGGGGYVGGGGGGGGPGNGASGGGGGSSFDSTGTATFQTGVREGDGLVTLTYACPPEPPAPCTVQTFDSPGAHTFTVPAWVTEIEPSVYGAEGGDVLPDTDPQSGEGGLGGGVVDLAIPVTPGESLEIVVGGAGGDATGAQSPAPAGGSPGGGGAGLVGSVFTSASGGGASEIRRGAQALVIAGGGGGAAHGGDGGHGGLRGTDGTRIPPGISGVRGGRSGGNGATGGSGATANGLNDGQDGGPGQGGTGGGTSTGGGGGGGGAVGGGGGGGGIAPIANWGGGGGGGSSSHATGPADYQTGVREGSGLVTIGFACAPPPPGEVTIDKRASDSRVVVGDTVTYRLVAKNNGAGPANAVVVEDRVPGKLDVRSASSTQGDCTVSGNQVRCELGTLAAGQEATVTIRATATEAGQSTNTGVVVADRCPAEGCDTDPAKVTIVKPKLRVAKTAAKPRVRAGNTLTYTIRVTNPSKRAVRNVRTCDLLPAGLVPVSATPKVKVSKGRYCWTAKRLGPGKSKRYELTVRALAGAAGRAVNKATASSPGVRSTARGARAVRVLGEQGAGGGVTG